MAAAPFKKRVYPRVCGGTILTMIGMTLTHGLSPRVRGNRGGATATGVMARSIPACAGEPAGCPGGDARS